MTERILGERGPNRKRRLKWLVPGLLLAVALLVLATPAIGSDPDAGTYKIVTDESGPNDVPGQKDLNLQGVDASSLPSGILKVLWNWDETGVSGSNTLDACSLFDTDSPLNGEADVAVCTTAGGTPAHYLSDTVYTCGDTRVDRCAS